MVEFLDISQVIEHKEIDASVCFCSVIFLSWEGQSIVHYNDQLMAKCKLKYVL